MTDAVEASLEIAAEIAGDITPAIYVRYFEKCPESYALMSHLDDLVMGKMMEEVFRLLMVENYAQEQDYLNFEVKNHKFAYSVKPFMYGNLLAAVHETIKEAISAQWTDQFESAWQVRVNNLTEELSQRG